MASAIVQPSPDRPITHTVWNVHDQLVAEAPSLDAAGTAMRTMYAEGTEPPLYVYDTAGQLVAWLREDGEVGKL